MRELGEIHRDKGKGYLNSFSLNRQMALLQANKDLISTGMKEFNVLLNQQVSLDTLFQMTKGWVRSEKGGKFGAGRVMVELMETIRDKEYKSEKRGCQSLWVILESYC